MEYAHTPESKTKLARPNDSKIFITVLLIDFCQIISYCASAWLSVSYKTITNMYNSLDRNNHCISSVTQVYNCAVMCI